MNPPSRSPVVGPLPFAPLRNDDDFHRFIGEFTSYESLKDFHYDQKTMRLERMESFARDLGHVHLARPAIHVAGTKGKGSTCLILEALLRAGSRAVGTYLSPHVEHIRERVRVGGRAIDEASLCDRLNEMLHVLEVRRHRGPRHFPTFFELMTAIAMSQFRKDRVEVAIYEVGLGGRLDATNILRPRWTVITGIGLEHTEKLGKDLASIAAEKAGIIKPGTPLVLGPVAPEARDTILRRAHDLGAPVVEVPPDLVQRKPDGQLRVALFDGPVAPGAVRGPGLRSDLALAITMWRLVLEADGVPPSRERLRDALASLSLPARVEVLRGDPTVVVDAAHTRESVRALRLALEEEGLADGATLVFSLASDKRREDILGELRGLGDAVIFTRGDAVRSTDPHVLAAALRELEAENRPEIEVLPDPIAAFERALARGRPVIVTGSFYLAGTIRRAVCPRR